MYFASRLQAGRMLASQLAPKYRYENCTVVALNDGGVMVGAQIAAELHCIITMFLAEAINLPREPEPIGAIMQDGRFIFNKQLSQGEIDDMSGEYFQFIEQEKFQKLHHLNELLGRGGLINRQLLRGHNIILVSDGFQSSFELEMALEFLKPIKYERLIIAAPLASVKAVDYMHISADEIYCLSVVENYMETDHYYDKHDVPDHVTIAKTIENIILKWR
ncbi:MAG: phosphoribosyltransferase family protein [Candidatus Saccharibacteria bacterium]